MKIALDRPNKDCYSINMNRKIVPGDLVELPIRNAKERVVSRKYAIILEDKTKYPSWWADIRNGFFKVFPLDHGGSEPYLVRGRDIELAEFNGGSKIVFNNFWKEGETHVHSKSGR